MKVVFIYLLRVPVMSSSIEPIGPSEDSPRLRIVSVILVAHGEFKG